VYQWVNNNPRIGLPASGAGNIPPFTAINNGTVPVVATITATAVPNDFAYLSNQGTGLVSVVSTATNTFVTTILTGINPLGVVVSPDNSKVYVADSTTNQVSAISTATNTIIGVIPVGKEPVNLTISPDGKFVYVTNNGANTISVISTGSNTVIATIQVQSNPYDLALSPDGSRLYINYNQNIFFDSAVKLVTVINTATNAVITNIPVKENVMGIVVSHDGSKVYMTNDQAGISVISIASNTEIAPIPLTLANYAGFNFPRGIALSPDGSQLYAANITDAGNITVVNTATNAIIDTLVVYNQDVYGIGVTPDGNHLYVPSAEGFSRTLVINTKTYAREAVVTFDGGASLANFISGGAGCTNSPVTFNITVIPTAIPPPLITPGNLSGAISACEGNASVSPYFEQFTVTGANLTGNITATAPAGFELSLNPGGVFSNPVVITKSGNGVNNQVVYVRSSASALVGAIQGNVLLSSPGAVSQNIVVYGMVNPLPALSAIPNQTVFNGQATTTVGFPNTINSVNWTNNTPGIGLPASGQGNIPSFNTINTSTSPITATLTVTPVSSPLAYVTNAALNNVSVINVTTNAIVNTINTALAPQAVAISADGSRAYIVDETSSAVSVFNALTSLVIATIPVDYDGPTGIAVSPDGSRIYVTNFTGGNGNVTVINTSTYYIIDQIILTNTPWGITVSQDGTRLYVTMHDDGDVNALVVIDAKTDTIIQNITVGRSPSGVVTSPAGDRLFVANTVAGTVSVINTATFSVIATVPVGQSPVGLAVSPDGSRVYVSCTGFGYFGAASNPGSVSVISTSNNTVVSTIAIGGYPAGISVSPDGSKVLVANYGQTDYLGGVPTPGSVFVINTSTNTVSATINVGGQPSSIGNFISNGAACSGTPVKFTITVKTSPVITTGSVSGDISACQGIVSTDPNIQQLTVSGTNLAGNITATAPMGFEVSLAAGSGYGDFVTLAPVAGTVNNTVVYARSAASAATGSISGNVMLSSPGAVSQNIAVSGTIGAPVAPAVTIATSINNICAGTPVTFTATPANGGIAPVYQWQVNGNNAVTNSIAFTGNSLVNGDVVTCIMTSNADCAVPAGVTSNSIAMIVNPVVAPSVSIVASVGTICAGTPVTFTATPVNGGAMPAYQWLVDGIDAGANNAEFTSNTLTNGDMVSCMMTSDAACAAPAGATSNSISMVVNPLPTVNAGGNKTLYEGSSITLNATATGELADITWSAATGLSDDKILNPIASPSITTTYVLTVQTTSGCTAIDSAKIEVVLPPVVIPNTFTPNGDGINDTWDIKYLDSYPGCTVQIFNRWGRQIYTSNGYGIPWDGTYKGKELPAGTYYYVINLKDINKLVSGFVTIIR
jgi:gliding motility-associated-like protein